MHEKRTRRLRTVFQVEVLGGVGSHTWSECSMLFDHNPVSSQSTRPHLLKRPACLLGAHSLRQASSRESTANNNQQARTQQRAVDILRQCLSQATPSHLHPQLQTHPLLPPSTPCATNFQHPLTAQPTSTSHPTNTNHQNVPDNQRPPRQSPYRRRRQRGHTDPGRHQRRLPPARQRQQEHLPPRGQDG